MFEEALRAMKQLNGTTYKMKIMPDKNGYLDKECPNHECLSKFKVWPEDWETKIEDISLLFPLSFYLLLNMS